MGLFSNLTTPSPNPYEAPTLSNDTLGLFGNLSQGTNTGMTGLDTEWLKSLFGDMDVSGLLGILTGAGKLYMGNKQLGLAEDIGRGYLDMAKDKWRMTKDELERTRKVRNNINRGYGGYGGA